MNMPWTFISTHDGYVAYCPGGRPANHAVPAATPRPHRAPAAAGPRSCRVRMPGADRLLDLLRTDKSRYEIFSAERLTASSPSLCISSCVDFPAAAGVPDWHRVGVYLSCHEVPGYCLGVAGRARLVAVPRGAGCADVSPAREGVMIMGSGGWS